MNAPARHPGNTPRAEADRAIDAAVLGLIAVNELRQAHATDTPENAERLASSLAFVRLDIEAAAGFYARAAAGGA